MAIVETLKEFRNILLGQKIVIHTDHKNLTYANFNTDRVIRWRLIIEEYGPDLRYIEGPKNIVADALSRLGLKDNPDFKDMLEQCNFYEHQILAAEAQEWLDHCADYNNEVMAANDTPVIKTMPIDLEVIKEHQDAEKCAQKMLGQDKRFHVKNFSGAESAVTNGTQLNLLCFSDRIVVPKVLQTKILEWYHYLLVHPGRDRTLKSISQHFYWKGMSKDVEKFCKKCPICQTTKVNSKKYGLLPAKEPEVVPWHQLCVDLIGPYKIPIKKYARSKDVKKKYSTIWCVTMIDPATSWFEMKQIPNKQAATVAQAVEQTWLCRYPWPKKITYDKGSEFMAEFATMIVEEYGIKKRGILPRNPQANSILERIHQVIGNMIKTFKIYDREDLEEQDPWSRILSTIMFGVRATYHTTLDATPTQLVFGRDTILPIQHQPDWDLIQNNKKKKIDLNNMRENKSRIPHEYKVGDMILISRNKRSKHGEREKNGPYPIVQVNNNGTVRYDKGTYSDIINIRQCEPYQV